jgi:glycoprotein-N-acetylgalactosamine 3-beta-galactosyltransferase
LRYLLHQHRAKTSLYIGHRYASKSTVDGYNAGGAYALSKKALEKFVTKLMHNKDACRMQNDGAEDLELGICLQNSTLFVDERDELKQKRFFPAGIYEHFNRKDENISYWYDQMLYYDSKYGGLDCCSDTSIGFHYVTPEEMYILDYLIYRVHPFAVAKNLTEVLPRKLTMQEVIESSDVPSNATDFVKHFVHHNFEESEKYS